MPRVNKDNPLKGQEEFLVRARKADAELARVQLKYRVKLSSVAKFQYLESGISVIAETIWKDNKPEFINKTSKSNV